MPWPRGNFTSGRWLEWIRALDSSPDVPPARKMVTANSIPPRCSDELMPVSIRWPKLSKTSNSLRNQTDLVASGERDVAFQGIACLTKSNELVPISPSSAPNPVPRCQVPWKRAPTSRRILFGAEGGHGIEPRRAVRRQIAGENGHGGESNGGKRNRQRVVRFEAEEHRARAL